MISEENKRELDSSFYLRERDQGVFYSKRDTCLGISEEMKAVDCPICRGGNYSHIYSFSPCENVIAIEQAVKNIVSYSTVTASLGRRISSRIAHPCFSKVIYLFKGR